VYACTSCTGTPTLPPIKGKNNFDSTEGCGGGLRSKGICTFGDPKTVPKKEGSIPCTTKNKKKQKKKKKGRQIIDR
jgi:hypothetical protein